MDCLLDAVGIGGATANKTQSCSARSYLGGKYTQTHVHLPWCDQQYSKNNNKECLRGQGLWTEHCETGSCMGLGKARRKFISAVPWADGAVFEKGHTCGRKRHIWGVWVTRKMKCVWKRTIERVERYKAGKIGKDQKTGGKVCHAAERRFRSLRTGSL